MSPASQLEAKIAEMRRLFDESFTTALPQRADEPEPMLAITLVGEPFALRVRELSGLAVSNEKIVPVPSRVPELLGLTGIRGIVVPVFSLAKLLGFDSEHGQAHWLVFCSDRQTPIALAFETMERLFEATDTQVFAREDAAARRYIDATVCEGTTRRGVISIPALENYIRTQGKSEHRK